MYAEHAEGLCRSYNGSGLLNLVFNEYKIVMFMGGKVMSSLFFIIIFTGTRT